MVNIDNLLIPLIWIHNTISNLVNKARIYVKDIEYKIQFDYFIAAGLVMLNTELAPGALRFVSWHKAEGGEGSAEGTTRRLVWVDADPDALKYMHSVDAYTLVHEI